MIHGLDFKVALRILARILKCPRCGSSYRKTNLNLLDGQFDGGGPANFLVHSDCGSCMSSVMIDVYMDSGELISAAVATDLTAKDATRIMGKQPISVDDVISIHAALKDFHGITETAK